MASLILTGPKPKEIKVETFIIDYLIRSPKVEKLSLQPIRIWGFNTNHETHMACSPAYTNPEPFKPDP